jgi:hypothetical protein
MKTKTTTLKFTADEVEVLLQGLCDQEFSDGLDQVADRLWKRLRNANRRLTEKGD